MFPTRRLAFALAVCASLVAAPAVRADDKTEKPNKPKPQPAAEPVKPVVIQIDASKLPPDVLKQLLQLADKKPAGEPTKPAVKPGAEPTKPGAKPAVKAISLSEAVAIVEKVTKSTVLKAEREDDDGEIEFEVVAVDAKGVVTEYTLDASGKIIEKEVKDEKKNKKDDDEKEEKGKGKKKDD